MMTFTIANKELRALFGSPLAWIILAVLQVILAYVFLGNVDGFLAIQPQLSTMANAPGITEIIVMPLFGSSAIFLLMAVPLMSMRMIAEERRNQTLTLLFSAPVSMTEIALGKFIGLIVFLGAIIGLIALMSLSLYLGGSIDLGLLAANVLGLILLAGAFAALGLFISSLTDQPIIAAVGSLGVLILLWIINISAGDANSVMHYLSLLKHFESFNRGMIDTTDLAYYILFIVLFLTLAIRRLDAERLRG